MESIGQYRDIVLEDLNVFMQVLLPRQSMKQLAVLGDATATTLSGFVGDLLILIASMIQMTLQCSGRTMIQFTEKGSPGLF